MGVWSKAQNYATASVFARRLLELNPSDARSVQNVRTLSPACVACLRL
jgi:hypothetical protein